MIIDEQLLECDGAKASSFVELLATELRNRNLDPGPVIAATRYDGADGGGGGWRSFTIELPNGLLRVIHLLPGREPPATRTRAEMARDLAVVIADSWRAADAIAASVASVQAAVEALFAEPEVASAGVRLVRVEAAPLTAPTHFAPTAVGIHHTALDAKLREIEIPLIVEDAAHARRVLEADIPDMRRRRERLERLRLAGADYLVDTFTLDLLALLGYSPTAALAAMGDGDEVHLEIPQDVRIDIAYLWRREGILWSQCWLDEDVSWADHRLVMHGKSLPATVMQSLTGMRLGDVVDHPLFQGDLRVSEARSNGNDLAIFDKPEFRFLRASDGMTWGDVEIALFDCDLSNEFFDFMI